MKRISFGLIVLVLFTSSCSQKKSDSLQIENEVQTDSLENNEETQLNPEFETYLEKMEYMELPYAVRCGINYTGYPVVDSELKERFTGKYSDPYRRIPTALPIEIVMSLAPADYLLPIIKTYSKEGKVVDSFQIFSGYCAGEPGWQGVEHFRISEKLKMVHIDSVWEHEVDSLYNEIEGTLKGTVKTTSFQILEDGNIVKLDSAVSYFN